MKIQKSMGFTLVELMVVIAIIGILLAIAIPQYQKYTIRSKAAQAIHALRPQQATVDEYVQLHKTMPADNLINASTTATDIEAATCDGIVKSVTYAQDTTNTTTQGTFTILFYTPPTTAGTAASTIADCNSTQISRMPSQLAGKTIVFTGVRVGSTVDWTITGGTLENDLRPILESL